MVQALPLSHKDRWACCIAQEEYEQWNEPPKNGTSRDIAKAFKNLGGSIPGNVIDKSKAGKSIRESPGPYRQSTAETPLSPFATSSPFCLSGMVCQYPFTSHCRKKQWVYGLTVSKVIWQDDEGWDDIDELLAQEDSQDSPSVSLDDGSVEIDSPKEMEDGVVEYTEKEEKREIKFRVKH